MPNLGDCPHYFLVTCYMYMHNDRSAHPLKHQKLPSETPSVRTSHTSACVTGGGGSSSYTVNNRPGTTGIRQMITPHGAGCCGPQLSTCLSTALGQGSTKLDGFICKTGRKKRSTKKKTFTGRIGAVFNYQITCKQLGTHKAIIHCDHYFLLPHRQISYIRIRL